MARYFLRWDHVDTGLLPEFLYFKKAEDLSDVLSPPSINELVASGGGGTYYFDYSPTFDIVYEVDGTASVTNSANRYIADTIGPRDVYVDEPSSQIRVDVWGDEDGYADSTKGANLIRLAHIEEGRWKIFTTGADANRLVLYDIDGSTVIQKWDLKDSTGAATSTDIFERVPVNTVP